MPNSSVAGTKTAWPRDRVIPNAEGQLPAGAVVVSADSHVLETENLWRDRLPEQYRDRAPHLWYDEAGGVHLEVEGRLLDPPGLSNLLVEGRPGMRDMEARLCDLDAEGVQKEILFPQRTLTLVGLEDLGLRGAVSYAYNEWIANLCQASPDRLYGVGILNWWDPARTRDDLQALRAQGFHAIEMPSSPPGVFYNSRAMDPLWQAIEESGYPVAFHIGENYQTKGPGALGTFIIQNFSPFRRLFGLLAFSGVLERHPNLRVIFTEGSIHWVPGALFDADRIYRDFESEMNPKLAQMPSYYWWQNCFATFQEDPVGMRLLDLIGPHKALWASDYPHPESTVGYTASVLRSIFSSTTEENARALVGGNAINLWSLGDET